MDIGGPLRTNADVEKRQEAQVGSEATITAPATSLILNNRSFGQTCGLSCDIVRRERLHFHWEKSA